MDTVDRFVSALNDVASSVGDSASAVSKATIRAVRTAADQAAARVASLSVASAPPPPPPPQSFLGAPLKPSKSTCVVFCVVGAAVAAVWVAYNRSRRRSRKRTAKRAPDGSRCECVLILGPPSEPLVRALAGDLNVRGFIVYIATPPEEEEIVAREKCSDIRALVLPADMNDSRAISAILQRFGQFLATPQLKNGSGPLALSLAGVIIVPDLCYPNGPVETLAPGALRDCVDSKLVQPLRLLNAGLIRLVRQQSARVLFVTPVVLGSLKPAFHACEALCVAGIEALALSLHRELESQRIPVVHLRLGSFDTGTLSRAHQRQVLSGMRAEVLSWPEQVRHLYAGAYTDSAHLVLNTAGGSSLAVLHNAVFDGLKSSHPPRVVYAGRFSRAYELLAAWTPERIMTLLQANASGVVEE